jgi:hypothetical protein
MDLKTFTSEISPAITTAGILVALWNSQRALKLSRSKNRADWMFQATMAFHKEEKLYTLFHKIDYGEFTFNLKCKAEGGDLGTEKEMELIYFLDFLNGVCAAFEADIFKEDYVIMSTLGYAIQRTVKNKVVGDYLAHVAAHDYRVENNSMYSFGFFRRVRNFRAFEHLRDVSDRLSHRGEKLPI